MEPQSSGVRTWQWVVTLIVIIALIIIGIFVFGGKGTETPDTGETPVSTQTGTPTSNSIIMSDQFPGNVVYISSVQASQPVWLEIHEDNNGQPGAIIGSALFQPGINPGRINLTKPTVDGRTYYAMLHADDGDGVFDATKDLPLRDSKGDIIMKVFRATVSADSQIKG